MRKKRAFIKIYVKLCLLCDFNFVSRRGHGVIFVSSISLEMYMEQAKLG